MIGTTGEPQRPALVPAEEGTYLELVYRLRPVGTLEFGPPQRVCVMEAAYVGRRDEGQWFGPDIALPASDTQTSRFHGVFVVHRERHLAMDYHDLGSENGSRIAGEPVARCPVVAGMCLRLGQGQGRSELQVVAVNPVRPPPAEYWHEPRYGALRGECAPLRRMFAGLDALVRDARESPVVVVRGPSGAGKKAIAWELLRRWEGRQLARIPYLDGRWLAAEPEPRPLATLLDAEAPAVVVDKLHGLSNRHQRELRAWLQARLAGRTSGRPRRLILLLEHRELSEPVLRDRELVKLLRAVPTVCLPGATTCGRDEVERFARHFLAKYQSEAPPGCRFQIGRCTLTPEAMAALRDEAWPGNWRQLQAVIEMAALGVAIDGREAIEASDLQLGYSEVNLPLEILFEMPLAAAEAIFRRTYLTWKFRKWAGNLSWVAQEVEFSKRGLLKTAKDVGLHDGNQIVWPHDEPWSLCDPQRAREEQRLRISLPSSAVWLRLAAQSGADVEAARDVLLELVERHPATMIEAALARQLRLDQCSPEELVHSCDRPGSRRK